MSCAAFNTSLHLLFFYVLRFFFFLHVSHSSDDLSTGVYLHLVWREEQRSSVISEWLVQQGNGIGHMRPRHWNWQTRQILNLNSFDKFTLYTVSKRNRKAKSGCHTSCLILSAPNKMKASTALKARSHQHLKCKINSVNGLIHKVNPQEKKVERKKIQKENLFW